MAKNNVGYQQLYELVDRRTGEIMAKFERLEERVSVLEIWRSRIMGQLAIMVGACIFVINFAGNWFYDHFVRGRG